MLFNRTVAKTCTYACTHMIVAFTITMCVTHSLKAALSISLLEPAIQVFAYSFHEKAWNRFAPDLPPSKKICC